MSSTSIASSYSPFALCHGVYVAEFDQLKGPFVLLDRPKCFENAKLQQIVAGLPSGQQQQQPYRRVPSNLSESPAPTSSSLATGDFFEAQGRLLETADRIARRLLAGSVSEVGEFLEVDDDDENNDDDDEEEQTLKRKPQQAKEEKKKKHLTEEEKSAIRERRHQLFSIFLDAVPVSKRSGAAAAMYNGLHHQGGNSINSASSVVSGSEYNAGMVSNQSFGGASVMTSMTTPSSQQHQQHSRFPSLGFINNNNHSSTAAAPRSKKVYVQNEAVLEMCVVCACTFALPDVYARGFRRDVTIFAICQRMNWQNISPLVSGALRLLGSRMCDNAMATFLQDVARVSGALTRVHEKLQILVKKDKEDRAKHEEEHGVSPPKPGYHFKMRRTEEEFNSLTALAKRMNVTPTSNSNIAVNQQQQQPPQQQDPNPILTSDKLNALSSLSSPNSGNIIINTSSDEEDEKIATKCRSRGQDALRAIYELCPLVWEEDQPNEEASTVIDSILKSPNESLASSSATIVTTTTALQNQNQQQSVQENNNEKFDGGVMNISEDNDNSSADPQQQQPPPPQSSSTQPNLHADPAVSDEIMNQENTKEEVQNNNNNNNNNDSSSSPATTNAKSHGHFPEHPTTCTPTNSTTRNNFKKHNNKNNNQLALKIENNKNSLLTPATSCSERHWDAAHTLLAKFTPLIMNTIEQEIKTKQLQHARLLAIGNRSRIMHSHSHHHQQGQQPPSPSAGTSSTSVAASSFPQTPMTIANNNNNNTANYQPSYYSTPPPPQNNNNNTNNNNSSMATATTTTPASAYPHHHQQHPHFPPPPPPSIGNITNMILKSYNFSGGKYHETKWNLRGFVYHPTTLVDDENENNNYNKTEGVGNSSSLSSLSQPTGSTPNMMIKTNSGHAEREEAEKMKRILERRRRKMLGLKKNASNHKEQHLILVNSMRKLLPSIFIPNFSTFPPIVVARCENPHLRNNNNSKNDVVKSNNQKNHDNNNKNSVLTKQFEIPPRLRQMQEKASSKLYSDNPGRFYQKYRNGVKGIKNANARQNVLPTIALFPAFCERK